MPNFRPLTEVQRRPVESVLTLRNESDHASMEAGRKLINEAKEFGLGIRDFLDLAIDINASETPEKYRDNDGNLSGYEATLLALNLPVRNDFNRGIVLDAASDTFQTYSGTRALFPAVVDDLVQWKYRQDQLETTKGFISQSRTINGVELLTTVVNDAEADYQVVAGVAEFGRIPVRTIRTSEQTVKIYKHGGGLRVSYEFQRRAKLDLLTPFQNRMVREMERSKVAAATAVLINGDGVNPAAPVVTQSSFGAGSTNGKIYYPNLLSWFIARAQAGTPIDTVVGSWDAYAEWLKMFAIPNSNYTRTDADQLAASGYQVGGVPLLTGVVNFALSSAVPAGQLIGLSKGDTLEELIEAGSYIDESERAIVNQSISYYKTENTGFRLSFGDTRSIYNFGA